MGQHRIDVRRFRPLLLPALIASLGAAAPAAAQTTTPAASPQVLEAITVTGTRRREPVRDVPVQLNTIPAEELEQAGAKTLTDYLATQPGLDLSTSGGPGLGSVTIRGVSTGSGPIATVGVYVDDIPFGSSSAYAIGAGSALDMGLLDLSRVEVLRGPQGTIYGASTMGGLIKYVTNDPDSSRFLGKVGLAASSTQSGSWNNTVNAVLNVPMSEGTAGFRIAAFRDHFGGFVDATGAAAGSDVNAGDTVGGRASLLFTPTQNLRIKLSATQQEIKRESKDSVDYDFATGGPATDALSKKLAEREPYSIKTGVLGLELDYDMGWARLDSITSGQKTDIDNRTDVTYVYGPLLAGAGLNFDRIILDNAVTVRRQAQELRLTSPRGTLEWIAGYFYNHEESTNGQLVTSRFSPGVVGPDLATVALPGEYTENAFFGDITWNATKTLSLTGGLRTAKNKQTFTQISDGPLAGGSSLIEGESSETTTTYLAAARYALTPTSNLYVRAASGYRPGGPNAVIKDPSTGLPTAPPTFKSDSLWSYEGGYKADLMDRRLSVDASIYTIKWKDLQQIYAVNGFGVIVNAGKAKVDGAEIALRYRATRELTLLGSYAHTSGKLTEDAPGLGSSGARLPNAPKDAASAGATYDFQAGAYKYTVGADVRYVGERNTGFEGSGTIPNFKLPNYTLVDLHAAGDFKAVQVALFARNLFDKKALLGAGTNFVPLGGYVQVTPAQPRTIGLSVSGTF